MSASGFWKWVRVVVIVLILGLIAFIAWGTWLNFDKDTTDTAVAAIHAQKITLADVSGKNLPPVPDQAQNDATVAGIDTNNNGVRDDVELAIFKKYPNDKQKRAAALQYAMAEQMFLTSVFNTETWKAVAEEDGRAALCVLEVKITRDEIENHVFDTQLRKDAENKAFDYITTHGSEPGTPCDVSF